MVSPRTDGVADEAAASRRSIAGRFGRAVSPPWAAYRWRWRAFVLAMLLLPTWPISGALLRASLVRLGLDDRSSGLAASPWVWLGLVEIAHLWRMSWRCPRCRRRFHVGRWRGDPFGRRCLHCGLPVGADPTSAPG